MADTIVCTSSCVLPASEERAINGAPPCISPLPLAAPLAEKLAEVLAAVLAEAAKSNSDGTLVTFALAGSVSELRPAYPLLLPAACRGTADGGVPDLRATRACLCTPPDAYMHGACYAPHLIDTHRIDTLLTLTHRIDTLLTLI